MASLGQKIRQERERLGIPLADIARETRISARYLEAIETEDTQTLPQDFFYRSFVRQYAAYLGISADEITVTLRRQGLDEALPMGNPAPKVLPTLLPVATEPAPTLRPLSTAFEDGRTSKRWLAVAALLLVGSVSYLATRRPTNSALTTVETAEVNPSVTVPVSGPSQTGASQTNPVTSPPQQLGTAVVQATNLGSGRLQIVISAREQTWIKLVADGKNIYMGLIEPGQSQAIENASNAELLTGNAGGIEVKQNGRSLPGLGSSGEVRTVVFDTENYQVRQPAPKAKPVEPSPVDGAKPTSSTE